MKPIVRFTDSKGRVVFPGFANATLLIEKVDDTEYRVRKARVIPEKEAKKSTSHRVTSNRFGVRGAAGYVIGQLDEAPRTEEELIRLAQERTPEGLRGTRYATNATVECPRLRELASEGKVIRERGADGHWRYHLPRGVTA